MNESIIWDGVYNAEPDFYPELAKYDGLRVRARVQGLNSNPKPEKLTIEVGLIDDPRVPDGIPLDSLQGRIKMLLWNAFWEGTVIFVREPIKK